MSTAGMPGDEMLSSMHRHTRTDGICAHVVVDKIIDSVNLCCELGWVEVHCRGAWQRDAVQHAHDVAALIAHQAP